MLAGAALGLAAALIAALALVILARPYDLARLDPGTASSLTLVDRGGRPLRVIPLAGGGRGRWLSLAQMPPALIAATLAGEDHRFQQHHGVDPRGILRALMLAARNGHAVSGASTITMQLVRLIEPHPRTLAAKATEMIDAVRLERAASKNVILEQYLNRAYYGGGAFGVDQGARRLFGKSAAALSDAEATLLAVLPRAPRRYDPLINLPDATARRAHVLGLMQGRGWLDARRMRQLAEQPLAFATGSTPDDEATDAAHFCDWVLATLPEDIRARGGVVRTTLDHELQARLSAAVRARLATTPGLQAGAVILDPATGAVRALVGSTNHGDRAGGQVNIVTTRRHPGSSLKPFVYALALEQGESPASLARDSMDGVPGFRPRRQMHTHGTTPFRDALAGSYNLAAVDVLQRAGVAPALERMRLAGLGPLAGSATDYGLDLALGAPRVRLLDLAAAYGFLINGGAVVPARAREDAPVAAGIRVFTAEAAWLTMDMLADAQARRAAFGSDLPLDLPFAVAAKTGTSSGFSDTVTIAATREAIVAAWVGAFDGSGTKGALAMWTAAPLVRAGLLAVADRQGAALTLPPAPPGIVTRTICRRTGQLAGAACPTHREHFTAARAPTTTCAGHGEPDVHASASEE
jgi:penicillin-binding protein 1C